jgi:hypothetical protein
MLPLSKAFMLLLPSNSERGFENSATRDFKSASVTVAPVGICRAPGRLFCKRTQILNHLAQVGLRKRNWVLTVAPVLVDRPAARLEAFQQKTLPMPPTGD